MARNAFDVIIAGVGGMGSAAAYHLARRGKSVLGLERFTIPNQMGSSHGVSRIIRLAYFEDPAYVPLLRRAYELWRELQSRAGTPLLHMTGCLDVGAAGTRVFDGALRSCEEHGLQHEVVDGRQLAARFPAYRMPPETMAIYEPEGGYLLPELCITAHAEGAKAAGATLLEDEPLLEWEATPSGVRVRTKRGTYDAERLILSSGSWMGAVAPSLMGVLQPERQVLGWLETGQPELFSADRFPVFVMEVPEGMYYGFPLHPGGPPGVKLGRFHHLEEPCDPETLDRRSNAADERLLREFAARYLPAAAGPALATAVCMFTNTPDENFIIDRHPDHSQVILAGGFSGHGFKFCSVVGEILADLAATGSTGHDIELFRATRFATLETR